MVLRMVGKDRQRQGKSLVCVHTAERSLRLMATGNQLHEHTIVKILLVHGCEFDWETLNVWDAEISSSLSPRAVVTGINLSSKPNPPISGKAEYSMGMLYRSYV